MVKDLRSGVAWSAGFQSSGVEPDDYALVFDEDRAEITRRDGFLTTTLDVIVSAEDDAEVRRVSITNSDSLDPKASFKDTLRLNTAHPSQTDFRPPLRERHLSNTARYLAISGREKTPRSFQTVRISK